MLMGACVPVCMCVRVCVSVDTMCICREYGTPCGSKIKQFSERVLTFPNVARKSQNTFQDFDAS